MYGLSSDFQKRDVAIYARVSTEHEAQLSALENQVDWYKPILAARLDWTLTAQYIDEGITGTSAEKRPQFMQMINDAKDRKFNMIITREVSRFARNTVDTLQYTRMLKECGVEVFFINDNIKTFDGDGELRLTIMATLAQDESRKTSIRVKAGQQTSMNNGVFYGTGNILEYDRVGKDLVINPEQAKTVRMIFDMYLSGMGVTKIAYELERLGRLTSTGKMTWHSAYLSHMLNNSFYCGLIMYHKEYTPDYLKQKKIKNNGDIEMTIIKGKHEPIITEEEYNKVQEIKAKRSLKRATKTNENARVGQKPHGTVWGKLLICKCGRKFNQHFHDRKDRHSGVDYQCYTSANRGSLEERTKRGLSTETACDSPYIPGWKLELMAKQIFENYLENTSKVLELSYSMLEKHIADKEEIIDNSDVIKRKQDEIDKLNRKRNNLFEMLTNEIKLLEPQEPKRTEEDFTATLNALKAKLESYVAPDTMKIPESVVEAFIERIWVSKDEFRWYLRRGNEKHRECSDDDRIKIAEFQVNLEQAKAYQYSFSTRKRVYKWVDLNVSVWL